MLKLTFGFIPLICRYENVIFGEQSSAVGLTKLSRTSNVFVIIITSNFCIINLHFDSLIRLNASFLEIEVWFYIDNFQATIYKNLSKPRLHSHLYFQLDTLHVSCWFPVCKNISKLHGLADLLLNITLKIISWTYRK